VFHEKRNLCLSRKPLYRQRAVMQPVHAQTGHQFDWRNVIFAPVSGYRNQLMSFNQSLQLQSFEHKRTLINASRNNQVGVSRTRPIYKIPGPCIHEQQRKVVLLLGAE